MYLSVLYLLLLFYIRDRICVTGQVLTNNATKEEYYIDEEVTAVKEYSPEQVHLFKCKQYHQRKKVIGGRNAVSGEFPHMAILGYGESDDITWKCGGSLISEEFVLTAAHCVYSKSGPLKFVRLGDIDLKSTFDDLHVQDFTIKKIYIHPSFKVPSFYYDLALLQLNKEINITTYVRPACLGITGDLANTKPLVVGWGLIRKGGKPSNILQTALMQYVSSERCNITYHPSAYLMHGIDDDLLICAGGRTERIDTCQGDSGGPLQIMNDFSDFGPFPEIVGITSFGKSCGRVAGGYTKVFYYVDWIKKIVWSSAWDIANEEVLDKETENLRLN